MLVTGVANFAHEILATYYRLLVRATQTGLPPHNQLMLQMLNANRVIRLNLLYSMQYHILCKSVKCNPVL